MFESLTRNYYEKLTQEQKRIIDFYDFAIQDAGNKEFIIDDMLGLMGDDTVIGKMRAEIASETIDKVVEYMETQKQDLILSFLDENVAEEE